MQTWTIQKLLNWITQYLEEKSIESARLSAEILLSHVLSLKRIDLYTQFDKIVPDDKLAILRQLVKRAAENEPIPYLTGRTEFYSLTIAVTQDTLIPRPETELLVETAIDFLRSIPAPQFVCDLCTGSGCIAVAIAKNVPSAKIIATDISQPALQVAAKNIEHHNLNNQIELKQGNLFEPLATDTDKPKFDLIVSNPPYVTSTEFNSLEKNIKDYEPKTALCAGPQGLDIYNKIAESINQHLKPEATLILEIGATQANKVKEILKQKTNLKNITTKKDFQKLDRLIIAKK